MKCVVENDQVIAHDDEINMLPRLAREAVKYIAARATDSNAAPFFLYVPFGSPHTPIVPTQEWQGKSGLGDYADFVMQTDAAVGEITDALEQHGFADETLVIFSSDNGCSEAAGIPQLAQQGHLVSAGYRGSKADLWDGGHRPWTQHAGPRVEKRYRQDQALEKRDEAMSWCLKRITTLGSSPPSIESPYIHENSCAVRSRCIDLVES